MLGDGLKLKIDQLVDCPILPRRPPSAGAATPPAYADEVATDDVEIGPDVEVGPTIEISPAGTAVLPDEIWAMIDEGSTLQPPPS